MISIFLGKIIFFYAGDTFPKEWSNQFIYSKYNTQYYNNKMI